MFADRYDASPELPLLKKSCSLVAMARSPIDIWGKK